MRARDSVASSLHESNSSLRLFLTICFFLNVEPFSICDCVYFGSFSVDILLLCYFYFGFCVVCVICFLITQGEDYQAPTILYLVGGMLWSMVFLGCFCIVRICVQDYKEREERRNK